MSLFFGVSQKCRVRAHNHFVQSMTMDDQQKAQGDMGGVYVLKVLLNLEACRNDQEKTKKMWE